MNNSYYSISSILADSTKIPCHFKLDVPHLSHLRSDPAVQAQQIHSASQASASTSGSNNNDHTIQKGTKLELPYWLAELLVLNDLVDVSIPKPYSQRVRNALNADANSVQLRNQVGFWYALGVRLGGLMESEMLMKVLSETYSARLPTVYSSAQHLSSASSALTNSLDLGGPSSSSSGSGQGSSGGGGGFGSSSSRTGMSAEMINFVNGIEESEKLALKASLDSAAAMNTYLAGRR